MCIVYCVCVSTYHMSLVAAPLRHLHMPRTQWQPRLLSGIAGLLQRFLELKNGPDYFRRMLHDVTVLSFGRLNLCIYIYMHNTIHIIPVHRHVFVNIVLRQKYDWFHARHGEDEAGRYISGSSSWKGYEYGTPKWGYQWSHFNGSSLELNNPLSRIQYWLVVSTPLKNII